MKKRWISYVVATWLALSAGVLFLSHQKYQSVYQSQIASLTEKSELQLEFLERELFSFEQQILSTLRLLSKSYALNSYAENPNEIDRRQIQQMWRSVLGYHRAFRQIRFVDISGDELIKVHLSSGKGIAAKKEYKNIGKTDYFHYAKTLKYRTIGSAEIELEQYSDNPIQRVIYPFDIMGKRSGYIIIDLSFWHSGQLFELGTSSTFPSQIITDNGDYVVHPNPEVLFGFQLQSREKFNFQNTNPDLWKVMNAKREGSEVDGENLFIFKELSLSKLGHMYSLIEISEQQIDELLVEDFKVIYGQAIVFIFMLIAVLMPTSSLLYTMRKRNFDSKLALAALNGMSAVLICDKKFLIQKVNHEFENITGYTERQIKYGSVKKLFFDRKESTKWFSIWESVSSEQFWEGELNIQGCSGTELTTITRIQAVYDSNSKVENYIISVVDITERKVLEEQLRYLSERDSLTQLWNRRKFEVELRSQTELCARYPQNHIGCLALVDIDHFKRINDQKGHDEGDRVINRVGAILTSSTRRTDFVARIGGEEFAILMPHTNLEEAETVLERMRVAVERDESAEVTISIGYTKLNSDSTDSYKCADIALYESKSLGRNRTSLCHSINDSVSA
ncbi:GGDEF domain-containing protein [Vibrio sp. HN007]|uniref:sensor domain-containing diguanylate cyclase n=1 Tax=Vibrio iocasae TaxID=3098914 RepID=UPI0035D44E19